MVEFLYFVNQNEITVGLQARRSPMLKFLVVCFITSSTLTAASAACRIQRVNFAIASTDTVATAGETDGEQCTMVFESKGVTYTNTSITKKASHGSVVKTSLVTFRYVPDKSFKGVDYFTIKLCGYNMQNTSGCVKVDYNITIR